MRYLINHLPYVLDIKNNIGNGILGGFYYTYTGVTHNGKAPTGASYGETNIIVNIDNYTPVINDTFKYESFESKIKSVNNNIISLVTGIDRNIPFNGNIQIIHYGNIKNELPVTNNELDLTDIVNLIPSDVTDTTYLFDDTSDGFVVNSSNGYRYQYHSKSTSSGVNTINGLSGDIILNSMTPRTLKFEKLGKTIEMYVEAIADTYPDGKNLWLGINSNGFMFYSPTGNLLLVSDGDTINYKDYGEIIGKTYFDSELNKKQDKIKLFYGNLTSAQAFNLDTGEKVDNPTNVTSLQYTYMEIGSMKENTININSVNGNITGNLTSFNKNGGISSISINKTTAEIIISESAIILGVLVINGKSYKFNGILNGGSDLEINWEII